MSIQVSCKGSDIEGKIKGTTPDGLLGKIFIATKKVVFSSPAKRSRNLEIRKFLKKKS